MFEYFDRVYVINLRRRADRLTAFFDELEKCDWPFAKPRVFPAVDGDAVSVPIWWKQGGGAWGCLMSHARILEDCIADDVKRVLIMEDDVTFVSNFAKRASAFLKEVPGDWDQIYFGGQHLRDPVKLSDGVYSCINVNRTHCYAVSRDFMPRMYRYIMNARDYIEHPGHHVDHRLGALHESGTVKVYAPKAWLVGQDENRSDISGRENPKLFWNTWADVEQAPMTVVLGLHESGANRVAGLMREIGVHFGHRLGGYRPPAVEDAGLANICERCFPFPSTQRKLPVSKSVPLIHDWCRLILREAADYGVVGGACYPHLCIMLEDMQRAWKNLQFIYYNEDFDTSM